MMDMILAIAVSPFLVFLLGIGIALIFLVLIISGLIRMSRYFKNITEEQRLQRLELDRLAEEMHQIRKQYSKNEQKERRET
jgi:hypothetical protein